MNLTSKKKYEYSSGYLMMNETTNTKTVKGKVVSAYGNQITWICVEGVGRQHFLTKDAKITLNGKRCRLDDLKVNMPVQVTVCDDDESKTSRISAEKIKSIPYT